MATAHILNPQNPDVSLCGLSQVDREVASPKDPTCDDCKELVKRVDQFQLK